MHPDVVFVDIAGGLGFSSADGQIDLCRNALGKSLRQPNLGPLPPRPLWAILQTFFKGGKWKIQKHCKSQFVLEEVIEHMRRGIISGKRLVKRKYRPEV